MRWRFVLYSIMVSIDHVQRMYGSQLCLGRTEQAEVTNDWSNSHEILTAFEYTKDAHTWRLPPPSARMDGRSGLDRENFNGNSQPKFPWPFYAKSPKLVILRGDFTIVYTVNEHGTMECAQHWVPIIHNSWRRQPHWSQLTGPWCVLVTCSLNFAVTYATVSRETLSTDFRFVLLGLGC